MLKVNVHLDIVMACQPHTCCRLGDLMVDLYQAAFDALLGWRPVQMGPVKSPTNPRTCSFLVNLHKPPNEIHNADSSNERKINPECRPQKPWPSTPTPRLDSRRWGRRQDKASCKYPHVCLHDSLWDIQGQSHEASLPSLVRIGIMDRWCARCRVNGDFNQMSGWHRVCVQCIQRTTVPYSWF